MVVYGVWRGIIIAREVEGRCCSHIIRPAKEMQHQSASGSTGGDLRVIPAVKGHCRERSSSLESEAREGEGELATGFLIVSERPCSPNNRAVHPFWPRGCVIMLTKRLLGCSK